MTTSVNYPAPVMVNGYQCKNCTEVDQAKAHIDPQHPNAGPYGVNAKADPTLGTKAVTFGGALSSLNGTGTGSGSSPAPPVSALGKQVDISA